MVLELTGLCPSTGSATALPPGPRTGPGPALGAVWFYVELVSGDEETHVSHSGWVT